MKFPLFTKCLVIAILPVLFAGTDFSSAMAQDSRASAAQSQSRITLQEKVSRLERELRAVQRRVFGNAVGADVGVQTASDAGAPAQNDRALLADLSVQVGSVERQLRQLTGRLEELEFEQRNMRSELELLRKEMNLRFDGQRVGDTRAADGEPTGDVASEPSENSTTELATEPLKEPVKEASVTLPDGTVAAQYDYAFEFIRANDLESGRRAMELFLERHPADDRAANAIFWLGRINLRQGQFGQAARFFLRLIDEHPGHDKRGDALVDLAESLIKLDSAPDACDALLEFRRVSETASPRLRDRAERLSGEAGCRQ